MAQSFLSLSGYTDVSKKLEVSSHHDQDQLESESDSGGEEFDLAHDRARLVKEKLEREEFLQVLIL